MQSGTVHNIISGEAVIDGTARTFNHEEGRHIKKALKRIVTNTAETYNATAHVNYQRSLHPIVFNDEYVTQKALKAALKVLPSQMLVNIPKMFLGEDFSVYQHRVPGTFAFVGAGNESMGRSFPNHHECFNIDEKAVLHAAILYVSFAME